MILGVLNMRSCSIMNYSFVKIKGTNAGCNILVKRNDYALNVIQAYASVADICTVILYVMTLQSIQIAAVSVDSSAYAMDVKM